MKQDYKKITGHANYSDDGILLEKLIENKKGKVSIVELGVGYGRHAVLWSHVLENKKQDAKYIVLDSQDYEGHEVAQTYATKRFDEFQCAVSIQKVDTLANAADLFENSTLDIVFLDTLQCKGKINEIVSKWCAKIAPEGVFVYLQTPYSEDIGSYPKIIDEFTKNNFLCDRIGDFVVCKKQLQTKTTKVENKNITKKSHHEDDI